MKPPAYASGVLLVVLLGFTNVAVARDHRRDACSMADRHWPALMPSEGARRRSYAEGDSRRGETVCMMSSAMCRLLSKPLCKTFAATNYTLTAHWRGMGVLVL